MEQSQPPAQPQASPAQSQPSQPQIPPAQPQANPQIPAQAQAPMQTATGISPTEHSFKRNIAFKRRIGELLSGKPIMENERLKHLELKDKQIIRANIIANIVDKYIQDGEKKFASLTLDDATGQIKVKTFGDDILKFEGFSQGDTILIIGMLRSWNNEVYITPEIIKKKSPEFLLVRKLEIEASVPKVLDNSQITELKDKIIKRIKDSEALGGVEVSLLIEELKEPPASINTEVKKLLENGVAYEPRPGKIRWLG